MPRANRRRDEPPPADVGKLATLGETIESFRGEPHVVRSISGAGATKAYRCPGCDQEIRPGIPHVVAWPQYDDNAADRRHWHATCWRARDRRAPTR
jgi:hypothetical protein